MSEASVSRGWGSKNFACIEAFNERNQCVKHLWEESDKDDPDFEATVYQLYLLYLTLIQDTSKRWNFFSTRYEEHYVPVCLGGNKSTHYKIYEKGDRPTPPQEPEKQVVAPQAPLTRSQRKRVINIKRNRRN